MRTHIFMLGFCAAVAGGAQAQTQAQTQTQMWPTRPVELVVAFTPGAITDILARSLADGLTRQLGQPVVVANRAGATGAIGSAAVARAAPDGYSLLFTPAVSLTVVPLQNQSVGYTWKSFEPVFQTFKNEMAIIARPDSKFKTVNDLIDAAKAQPGKLSYGHLGIASIPHLAMTELALYAKAEFNAIPYKGDSEVMAAVLGGHTDFGAVVLSSAAGGPLNILGLFGDVRNPRVPGVPTLREQGFQVAPTSFGGIVGPAGLASAVKAKLADACASAAQADAYKNLALGLGQPVDYYADASAFTRRLEQDAQDKARLLSALGDLK